MTRSPGLLAVFLSTIVCGCREQDRVADSPSGRAEKSLDQRQHFCQTGLLVACTGDDPLATETGLRPGLSVGARILLVTAIVPPAGAEFVVLIQTSRAPVVTPMTSIGLLSLAGEAKRPYTGAEILFDKPGPVSLEVRCDDRVYWSGQFVAEEVDHVLLCTECDEDDLNKFVWLQVAPSVKVGEVVTWRLMARSRNDEDLVGVPPMVVTRSETTVTGPPQDGRADVSVSEAPWPHGKTLRVEPRVAGRCPLIIRDETSGRELASPNLRIID